MVAGMEIVEPEDKGGGAEDEDTLLDAKGKLRDTLLLAAPHSCWASDSAEPRSEGQFPEIHVTICAAKVLFAQ